MSYGGARRDRTADLYNAIVALSQLSYSPNLLRTPACGIHTFRSLYFFMVTSPYTMRLGVVSVNRQNNVDKQIWEVARSVGARKLVP